MRALFCLLFAFSLSAQAPYLVKDINTTYAFDTASSSPASFTAWRNRIYFVATLNDQSGTELWSTDGTSAGTSIVADILPGSASSSPASLAAINDTFLFSARNVNHGIELWTTDGTAAGTKLLLDLSPGPNSSLPSFGPVYKNRLYFVADDGLTGRELWSTDGTAAGTRQVKDLQPGAGSSSPRYFVTLDDTLYFIAGTGLWKTDGTEAGTVQVTTVNARSLTVAGSRIFFEGFTAESSWELWVSDGTAAGTHIVKEILPGARSPWLPNAGQGFTPIGNRVLFLATDDEHGKELWTSDGTAAGTQVLREFRPGPEGVSFMSIALFQGRAVFSAEDPEHGLEMWATDGTPAGTSLFLDLIPGPESLRPYSFVAAGQKMFFIAESGGGAYDSRLWVTDGTLNGTRRIRAAGSDFDFPGGPLRAVDGKVYFAGHTFLAGTEPWVSDGTDAGTHMIANLGADRAPSSFPRLFAGTTNLLFFHATEGTIADSNSAEASLWRTDGTAGGTFKLLETGQHPAPLTSVGPFVFFFPQVNHSPLMISDGTHAGTKSADDFRRRFGEREIYRLFPYGDTLFASIDSSTRALWKTTLAPNAPAVSLGATDVSELHPVGDRYMFLGESPHSFDPALWITDGTVAGTYPVVPELTDASYGLSELANAGGTVYFVMKKREEAKAKLWQSDGTFDGTVPVKELPFDFTAEIAEAGRRVFFTTGQAVWTSDGTADGTIELLKANLERPYNSSYLKALGARILFLVEKPEYQYELWSSDGTIAGTKLLVTKNAGFPAVIDGIGYFAHSDPEHGSEIWTTDGTPEGTKLLLDVNPGPGSSNPEEFTKVGNVLYFSAHTTGTGQELWALPLTDARLTIDDARAAESASVARFQVSLGAAAATAVTVDYSTSDGTARAGQDYQAASGRLTFAPGETSKAIDVHLLGDTSPENNETFVLTLQNAIGARLLRTDAAGIIDDDDQLADLSAAMVFRSDGFDLDETVAVSNHGPRSATNVDIEFTHVPGGDVQECYYACGIPQLAAGATEERSVPDTYAQRQHYRSAIASARQPDASLSNNAVSWTTNPSETMAMSPAYLTPGATATVTVSTYSSMPLPEPISYDPSILLISSPVTKGENIATFTVTAVKAGTARLVAADQRVLDVLVVAPGTVPRWPDGVEIRTELSRIRIDQPLPVIVTPQASAPLTGARPTGTVVVSVDGQELARRELTGGSEPMTIPVYFRTAGTNALQIWYSGDANFLPHTEVAGVYVDKGKVSITGHLEKVPGDTHAYVVKVRVEGVPGYAPTGSLLLFHNNVVKGSATLTPFPNGASTAETTLVNLPQSPTITVRFDGSALYDSEWQDIRLVETRTRAVRH